MDVSSLISDQGSFPQESQTDAIRVQGIWDNPYAVLAVAEGCGAAIASVGRVG